MGQFVAPPGDRPIYGTIRIPDLSGAEEGRFPSITPRAFRQGRNNSQRAGSKPGNPPVCPRFHDIPARYRVGLSGRSMAWRRSGRSLREGRQAIPGMEGPNFVATKKCALFYCATKFGLKGVFHIQNAGPLGRPVDTPRAKRPALGVGQPPAPPLSPSPHVPSGAFPRGLPRPMPGFPRGSSPRRRTRQAHGIRPDKTSAFPGVCPPAFQPPGHPGDPPRSGRGFSRPSPRALPGKRMGRAWGDGGSGGGDGRS
jgi:hypothetical protein